MTHNTPQDHTPIGTGPAGLIRRLDRIFLTLILGVIALNIWGKAPRISLAVTIAAICVVVARVVIEHRSGVTRPATGARAAAWLVLASGTALAAWLFPAGSFTRSVTLVILLAFLSLGLGELARWRARSRHA